METNMLFITITALNFVYTKSCPKHHSKPTINNKCTAPASYTVGGTTDFFLTKHKGYTRTEMTPLHHTSAVSISKSLVLSCLRTSSPMLTPVPISCAASPSRIKLSLGLLTESGERETLRSLLPLPWLPGPGRVSMGGNGGGECGGEQSDTADVL